MLDLELYGEVFLSETKEGKEFYAYMEQLVEDFRNSFDKRFLFEAYLVPEEFEDKLRDMVENLFEAVENEFEEISNVTVRHEKYFRFNFNGEEIYVHSYDLRAEFEKFIADRIIYLTEPLDAFQSISLSYILFCFYFPSSRENLEEYLNILYTKFSKENYHSNVSLDEFKDYVSDLEGFNVPKKFWHVLTR